MKIEISDMGKDAGNLVLIYPETDLEKARLELIAKDAGSSVSIDEYDGRLCIHKDLLLTIIEKHFGGYYDWSGLDTFLTS